jgi:hypothetical protein
MRSRPMLRVSPKGVKRIVKQEGELNKIERSDEWHSNDTMHGKDHFGPLHNEKKPKKYPYNHPKDGLPKDKKDAKKHHKSPKRHTAKGKGKIEKVMHDFKEGKLHSGSKKGPVVANPKQAIAIAISEKKKMGGKAKKKK